jgi:serine protease Do
MEGSPAAEAGIQTGDVIVEYNGNTVEESNQLPIMVARTKVGETVKVTVVRDKKKIPLTIEVGELKQEEMVASAARSEEQLGLTVQNVTPETAESLGLKRSSGVVITSVQPQSPAAAAGLRRGDVILEVNRTSVGDVGEVKKLLTQARARENILFLISRAGNNLFLAMKSPGTQG